MTCCLVPGYESSPTMLKVARLGDDQSAALRPPRFLRPIPVFAFSGASRVWLPPLIRSHKLSRPCRG